MHAMSTLGCQLQSTDDKGNKENMGPGTKFQVKKHCHSHNEELTEIKQLLINQEEHC